MALPLGATDWKCGAPLDMLNDAGLMRADDFDTEA